MAKYYLCCATLILLVASVELVSAQEEPACYTGGSIATAVIITIIVVLFLVGLSYFGWIRYGKYKKGKHLILETDPEKGANEYAFDNPGFKDAGLTPIGKVIEKNNKLETGKPKWSHWSPLGALTSKTEKRKTVDDTALDGTSAKVVSLRSHDFTGLGFNICGNMRDGIYIKDVLHRGPASESGKLSPGDRIDSITINFEHIVYEDALTILSYASPYEVVIEARNGRLNAAHTAQSGYPGHPLYKSSSSMDLLQIGRSAKKRLFQAEELNDSLSSNYSSLQKTRSTATTLERTQDSPKQRNHKKPPAAKPHLSPEQLKTQLEQKILEDHNDNLKNKQNYDNAIMKEEVETQKTESKFPKFGIKVLPMEQKEEKSAKNSELSQNDNNINIERNFDIKATEIVMPAIGIDEVDKKAAPPVKRREKKAPEPEVVALERAEPETFIRDNCLNSSGIKRDENGIPQEIPNHMLNAAVAARKNRKPIEEKIAERDDPKSSKKPKGKAPAPPPEGLRTSMESLNDIDGSKLNFTNLDEISPAEDNEVKAVHQIEHDDHLDSNLKPPTPEVRTEIKDYNSDSDIETDNQSSVNTIELNASHITIHQAEENDDKQNRKTASTGDLTKIQKTRKTSTGTLERAQSLDITDAGMPVLSKKRKGGKLEDNFDSKTSSDESLYGNALINKEPRLSLILDGLNTFQRSRLKKSTEWGNLEDAILNLNRSVSSESLDRENGEQKFDFRNSSETFDNKFDFGTKSPEFDALVNKINEIKQETNKIDVDDGKAMELNVDAMIKDDSRRFTNDVWSKFSPAKRELFSVDGDENQRGGEFFEPLVYTKTSKHDDEIITILSGDVAAPKIPEATKIIGEAMATNKSEDSNPVVISRETKIIGEAMATNKSEDSNPVVISREFKFDDVAASNNLLLAEREASIKDFYNVNKLDDTNVPDDIKVSRHSLGSLERPKFDEKSTKSKSNQDKQNVSNVTVSDQFIELNLKGNAPTCETFTKSTGGDDYATKILKNDDEKITLEKIVVSTPDLIKNVSIAEALHDLNNEVTVEGPTSLTFEIPGKVSVTETQFSNNHPSLEVNDFHLKPFNLSNGKLKDYYDPDSKKSSLTYITEIQVITPNSRASTNISEIEIIPNIQATVKNLDSEFEKYVKNFESPTERPNDPTNESSKSLVITNKIDPEKELHKIQEIAEEQLKKLPEMRFTTSSYEPAKTPEKRQSHIELLRSNFERSPPKPSKPETIKSRIPIATSKTPPTSPERRDSRNLDLEMDKEIIEIMASGIHSPTSLKYQPKAAASRNVTVTSIRNSKIPSGLPTYGSRPPVPPRKSDSSDGGGSLIQVSANGSSENSFKQWVFNPTENSITNITVTENEIEK